MERSGGKNKMSKVGRVIKKKKTHRIDQCGTVPIIAKITKASDETIGDDLARNTRTKSPKNKRELHRFVWKKTNPKTYFSVG
jgi:hypothetical protein